MYAKALLSMFDVQVRWSELFQTMETDYRHRATCDCERIAWLERGGRRGKKEFLELKLAPRAGFEPATRRLTAVCSTD
jgi:hypothetical protein